PPCPSVVHPFPTRRSSDLAAREALMAEVRSGLAQVENLLREAADASGDKASELRESALEGLRRASDVLNDAQDSVVRHSRAAARDRKSTRLNSSHVKISYA